MADDGKDFHILQDLQVHLRTANVPLDNLSTLAQQGDDKNHFTLDTYSQQLVEQFLTENVKIEGSGPDVLHSQFYIACFWGVRDIVTSLLEKGVDPNKQNKGTMWTPLHAATFQEHGPILMILLEYGARPDLCDAEGRTPADFASASDKIWPHFAAMGIRRTTKEELLEKGVIKPSSSLSGGMRRQGIPMASYDRTEPKYEYNSDPFIQAAVTGDVLADTDDTDNPSSTAGKPAQPQFSMWR